MSDQDFRNDCDVSDALTYVRRAIEKITAIAGRDDAELCSDLVGTEPALRQVRDQLADAQRSFQQRVRSREKV